MINHHTNDKLLMCFLLTFLAIHLLQRVNVQICKCADVQVVFYNCVNQLTQRYAVRWLADRHPEV